LTARLASGELDRAPVISKSMSLAKRKVKKTSGDEDQTAMEVDGAEGKAEVVDSIEGKSKGVGSVKGKGKAKAEDNQDSDKDEKMQVNLKAQKWQ